MEPLNTLTQNLPRLLDGTLTTLHMVIVAACCAAVIVPIMAVARADLRGIPATILAMWVSFVRGTPLIAQLFLVFYGTGQFRSELQSLGLWPFFRDPFFCATLVLVIYTTAYQSEALRGALLAVPKGELEAARAIGMSRMRQLFRVRYPHAFRLAFPSIGNELVILVKGSALASVVTVFDLMGRSREIFLRGFDYSIYLWAAVLYLAITSLITLGCRLVERRLNRHLTALPAQNMLSSGART